MASLLELLITDVHPRQIVSALGARAVVVPLPGAPDLSLVPVTDDLSMITDCTDVVDGFELLTDGLVARIVELSRTGRVLYVHVELHAGLGFHAVAGWRHGHPVLGPLFTANHEGERIHDGYVVAKLEDMAANVGLRFLGVVPGPALDEFATAGLDRFRWTAEWAGARS